MSKVLYTDFLKGMSKNQNWWVGVLKFKLKHFIFLDTDWVGLALALALVIRFGFS